VLAGVANALIDGADVVVVAIFSVDTAVVHWLVNAVPVGAMSFLASLRFAIIGAGATIRLLVVLAATLLFTGQDVTNVDGADLAVVAHAVRGAAIVPQRVLTFVVRVANIVCAGVSVVAVIVDEATSRGRGVVTELIRATLVGTDVDDAVLSLAGRRDGGEVYLARGPGDGVDAVGAVGVLLAATGSYNLPVAESVLAGVNGTRVAVIADQFSRIRGTALGPYRRVGTAPVFALVNGATNSVVALQRSLAATGGLQNLILAGVIDTGTGRAGVIVVTISVVIAAIRVIGVLVDADSLETPVFSAGVAVLARAVVNAGLVLAVDASIHLAEVVGGGIFIIALSGISTAVTSRGLVVSAAGINTAI
jgi:hypothetical protein